MGVSDQRGGLGNGELVASEGSIPGSWFLSTLRAWAKPVHHLRQPLPSVSNRKLLNIGGAQGLSIIQSLRDLSKLRSLNSRQKWVSYSPSLVPPFLHPRGRCNHGVYQIRVQWSWNDFMFKKSKDKLLVTVFPLGSHLTHWMLLKGFQAGWGDSSVGKVFNCECVESPGPVWKSRVLCTPLESQHCGGSDSRIPGIPWPVEVPVSVNKMMMSEERHPSGLDIRPPHNRAIHVRHDTRIDMRRTCCF